MKLRSKNTILTAVIILLICLAGAWYAVLPYKLTRSLVIRKPADSVFAYIRLIRNQDHYTSWMDNAAILPYDSARDGMPGFLVRWYMPKSGYKGQQQIIAVAENSEICTRYLFNDPNEICYDTRMNVLPSEDGGTWLIWTFHGGYTSRIAQVKGRIRGLGSLISTDMEHSLQRLKIILENR